MRIRFKGRLKEEHITSGNLDAVLFEWAKLKKDTYLVYFPKIFRRQEGGTFAILSEKNMNILFKKLRKSNGEIQGINK